MDAVNKSIDESSVRSALEEVFSSTEFQPEEADSTSEAVKEILIKFFGWLDSLIPEGTSGSLFWFILAIGAAIFFFYKFINWCLENTSDMLPYKDEFEEVNQVESALCRESYKNAFNEGRMREALWHLHRLWLLELSQRKQIQFCSWKSNQRYLSECPKEAEKKLAALTQLYEHCIYGGNEIDNEALRAYSLQDI